jgi:hypothetical protein
VTEPAAPYDLRPYRRAAFPRDALWSLWAAMEADGGARAVFYASPEATRGDLVDFVRAMEPPGPGGAAALVAHEGGEAVGLLWFTDVVPGVRAAVNLWYARRRRGPRAVATTAAACDWAEGALGVPAVWGYTPWPAARAHGERAGFRLVAELPGYVALDGARRPMYVLRRGGE